MAKTITEYVCQSCGHRAPKWLGKCPECEAWNTLAEEKIKGIGLNRKTRSGAVDIKLVQPVTKVEGLAQNRLITGIGEFDRTLGGGLVEGSLVLIGGEPGIGKSTLLLQSMGEMAKSGAKVLYISGEESPAQIKLRANRAPGRSQKATQRTFRAANQEMAKIHRCSRTAQDLPGNTTEPSY